MYRKINKKHIFVLSIVLGLCFISFLNYNFNKSYTLETSSEFVEYEENIMKERAKNINNEDIFVEEANTENNGNTEMLVIDSKENTSETTSTVTKDTKLDETNAVTLDETNTVFLESKLNIDTERSKIISLLTEIIEDEDINEVSKSKAIDDKIKIIDYMNKEKVIENLLKTKMYKDFIVIITDNSVNVTVGIEKLNKSDLAKILDIVMRETNRPLDQIKIQCKY